MLPHIILSLADFPPTTGKANGHICEPGVLRLFVLAWRSCFIMRASNITQRDPDQQKLLFGVKKIEERRKALPDNLSLLARMLARPLNGIISACELVKQLSINSTISRQAAV